MTAPHYSERQELPIGIQRGNQCFLFSPRPPLQLLFPRNSRSYIRKPLYIHQIIAEVASRKSLRLSPVIIMLRQAVADIACHPNIQDSAGWVSRDVDVVGHGLELSC